MGPLNLYRIQNLKSMPKDASKQGDILVTSLEQPAYSMLLYCTSLGSKVRQHEPRLLKCPHRCYQHKDPNLPGFVDWGVK